MDLDIVGQCKLDSMGIPGESHIPALKIGLCSFVMRKFILWIRHLFLSY